MSKLINLNFCSRGSIAMLFDTDVPFFVQFVVTA